MAPENDEEARLRAVALHNAQSILVARRRAEEALREQSEWLRITLASIGDAVITTDADGRVTFMNTVAQALTGWSQGDALGLPLTDAFRIVHADTRQPVENPALRALQTGTIIRLANHTVLVARTGEEHPIDDSAAPIRDESGTTVGAVLIFRDVSDRKRTDLTRAHLAAIVDSSDDAIVSKTLRSIILSWNHGAERLFGYSAQEAIGQPITMLLPPERLEEEQQILERIIRGERIEHFETVRVRKDGRRIDISLTISPIRDASGEIVGASKVARDISLRKSLEARNSELREREQRARQEAEAANRAKDEFLAMLGHELRNPLSPIVTALQLMKLRGGGGLERERAVIERQVSHLTRLVDDLLDVSRIARGKVELKEELVDIADVVAKAIEVATPLLDQRTHVLDVDVPPRLWVRGDAIRLTQVLSNLLTNAAKYTPPGGRITVRATDERGEIVIRVRDTGIGIAPDALPRVFDLFAQERQTIDRSQGGLGLGLTIVRNLVERHGGTVSAHSDGLGTGSEFVVRLRRANAPVEPAVAGDYQHPTRGSHRATPRDGSSWSTTASMAPRCSRRRCAPRATRRRWPLMHRRRCASPSNSSQRLPFWTSAYRSWMATNSPLAFEACQRCAASHCARSPATGRTRTAKKRATPGSIITSLSRSFSTPSRPFSVTAREATILAIPIPLSGGWTAP